MIEKVLHRGNMLKAYTHVLANKGSAGVDGMRVEELAAHLKENRDAIATAIFTDFALPFEIISLLLLVAIIGAIYLARRPEEDERAN